MTILVGPGVYRKTVLNEAVQPGLIEVCRRKSVDSG